MFVISFGTRLTLDIIETLLHIVSIGLTLLRLYYRRSTSRLGWDDYTAGLAAFIDTAYFAVLWPFFSCISNTKLANLQISSRNKYWLDVELFFAMIGLCRISIALAIARIFPAKEPIRKFIIGLAVFFGFMFFALQLTVICGAPSSSPALGGPKCQWALSLTLSYLFINIVSDLFLVGIPLYKLWRVRLPTRQRKLVLAGFAAGLPMTLGAIGASIFQFAPSSWEPGRTQLRLRFSYIEAAVCLAACNLLVVITYLDNMRRRALDRTNRSLNRTSSPDTLQPRGPPPMHHSNEVPSASEMYSTLVLTEITDAFITVDTENTQETSSVVLNLSFVSTGEEDERSGLRSHDPSTHWSDPPLRM